MTTGREGPVRTGPVALDDQTVTGDAAPSHPPGPRQYFLVIRNETSSLFPLPERGQLLAGRGAEADLRVEDQSASRAHARFVVERGTVRVLDLGSRNRTWVNGQALAAGTERALASGDVVQIGSMTLVLNLSRGGGATATERAVAGAGALAAGGEAIPATVIDMAGGAVLLADPAMVRLYELLRRLARSALPVLITGETGTGKENAAQAVHFFSSRRAGPMLAINCAAIPENLFESELFGHVRGAFSGALTDKVGRLESASGGTVFLDEIAELPLPAQAKLLRTLETGTVSPVGSLRDRPIDCRVVAATHRDLEVESQAGRFRQDLYFRLAAATVTLPPLRERPAEVALLAAHFLRTAAHKLGRGELTLGDTTLALLQRYPFPGNVRELRNLMDYCAATVGEVQVQPWHLPPRFAAGAGERAGGPSGDGTEAAASGAGERGKAAVGATAFRNLADEVQELERRRMREALASTGGNQRRAAELIGMPLRTFVTKLRQYGLREG